MTHEIAKEIFRAINVHMGISTESLFSHKRKLPLVHAREIGMRIMREQGFPLVQIAEAINRTHSSVCHALKAFENDYSSSRVFQYTYYNVKQLINFNLNNQTNNDTRRIRKI